MHVSGMNGAQGIKNHRGELQRVLSREESYVDGKLSRAAFISIAILTFITFVGNFTQLQLSSALPIIVSEFHISVTTGQWLTSVFQLVMGVMVPLTAFLTRRFSTRQIVICSMAVFTVGSLLAWLGPNFVWVLVGRVLEAAGTGVMWPVLQITVFSIYPLSRRGFAMGTVGMAMSVAPAIGPTLGGWQTDANGWRSIFLTMTVIGVVSLLAAMFGLHNFGSMVVGLVGIVWFVMRNLRAGKRYREAVAKDESALPQPPLLDLEVLKNRSFTVGTITASLAFFAFSSILVIMPLYIQTDRGYSATMSGLIMLPGAIGQCVSQFFGGRAMDRFGARPVALFGSIVLTLGTLGMSLVAMDTWIWWVSICQFIRQIGMGFLLMPITTWSLNCLNGPSEVSAGSSVTNTARQIAGAVGAPVLVILMETFAALHKQGGASAVAASIFGIQWALRISAIICLAMVLMVFFGVKGDGAGRTRDIISLRALRERRARRMAAN